MQEILSRLVLLVIFSLNISWSALCQSPVRPRVQKIVNILAKDRMLHLGGRVGYSAQPEKNKYVTNYKKLIKVAKEDELVYLTKDTNKIVALYAYSTLYKKSYHGVKSIFLKNIQDTAYVWASGGCTGVLYRVNEFMLSLLNPEYSKQEAYMTKEEYQDLYNKIVRR